MRTAGLIFFLVSALALFLMIIFGGFGSNVAANHQPGSFPSRGTWEKANTHPDGLDCWIFHDPELGLNSPYLMECSPPRGPKK